MFKTFINAYKKIYSIHFYIFNDTIEPIHKHNIDDIIHVLIFTK